MKNQNLPAEPPPIDKFHLPRFSEIPDVGLYLEQTVKLLNSYLAPLGEAELTASMVSNYVKQKLLPRPEKKLYYNSHIAQLVFIGVAKNVAALEDIRLLLELQAEKYDLAAAYEYFSQAFEAALHQAFGLSGKKALPAEASDTDSEDRVLLHRLIRAAVDKIYLDHGLRSLRLSSEPPHE